MVYIDGCNESNGIAIVLNFFDCHLNTGREEKLE